MALTPNSTEELLLNTKLLPPRHPDADAVIARIVRLKIDGWNETQVRAEVIDHLVRILGYDVESFFSIDREKPVKVLQNDKALDYTMTLFAESFWLIEAKRPSPGPSFGADALYQALKYAAHPDIDAALIVLCDGFKIEVFDRETTLREPILSIPRSDLAAEFDKLRALLSPWQVFFFEKRRLLRRVDKVFDQETHIERIEEMRDALDTRLASKRAQVMRNHRERID